MTAKTHTYLLEMPDAVLFGPAAPIEAWLTEHRKMRPSLLDLELARAERRANR